MTSLQLLTIPEVWWKKRSYVSATSWSKTLITFLTMHAGLGNRSDKYKKYAVYIEHGRIVTCPLCNIGSNNEIHILVECKNLKQFRISTKLKSGMNLEKKLQSYTDYGYKSSAFKARMFLSMEPNLGKADYMERGFILQDLLTEFFSLWSDLVGEVIGIEN